MMERFLHDDSRWRIRADKSETFTCPAIARNEIQEPTRQPVPYVVRLARHDFTCGRIDCHLLQRNAMYREAMRREALDCEQVMQLRDR